MRKASKEHKEDGVMFWLNKNRELWACWRSYDKWRVTEQTWTALKVSSQMEINRRRARARAPIRFRVYEKNVATERYRECSNEKGPKGGASERKREQNESERQIDESNKLKFNSDWLRALRKPNHGRKCIRIATFHRSTSLGNIWKRRKSK